MLAKILSGATIGLNPIIVEVEVDIVNKGLPAFNIVGLPGKAVEEAKERVRTALKNSGIEFPKHRITINLTPADLPKEGPAYDLPIALGIMLASGKVRADIGRVLVFGELSLDGSLRHTNGSLSMALLAKKEKINQIFLPAVNAYEAALVRGLKIYPIESLIQLFRHLQKSFLIKAQPETKINFYKKNRLKSDFDLGDVLGQEQAKRALEIASAGNHNVLMSGPPGAGKTMLARIMPSIMPDMTEEEILEVTKIYSVSGNLPTGESVISKRPFRSPHHTISRIGLVGGGSRPMPGEISLAHRGVLFMDEFPEFPRNVLEVLRQPMEDGMVTISRAAGNSTFPARFLLIAAMNPCPCGNLGSLKKACSCMSSQVSRYLKKISGPILDRIDLHLSVPEVEVEKLSKASRAETSLAVQKRVQRARNKQLHRFGKLKLKIKANSELNTKQIKQFCPLSSESKKLLTQAANTMGLSARSYFRIIKIARTIADLEGEKEILPIFIAEALQYRPKQP